MDGHSPRLVSSYTKGSQPNHAARLTPFSYICISDIGLCGSVRNVVRNSRSAMDRFSSRCLKIAGLCFAVPGTFRDGTYRSRAFTWSWLSGAEWSVPPYMSWPVHAIINTNIYICMNNKIPTSHSGEGHTNSNSS